MMEDKINDMDEQMFLNKYFHAQSSVKEIGLDWRSLVEIYEDYKSKKSDLSLIAAGEHPILMEAPGAYIVRYRVKDPEHLIDKIIRKKLADNEVVTKENYLTRFDDLIGFRILHLFKDNWRPIHEYIRDKYNLNEMPIVYYRPGDSEEFLKQCQDMGVEPKAKPAGYRSIHYVVKKSFLGFPYTFEIQVRTIFEDAWSEIDHLIRYPNQTQDKLLNKYLLLFNSVAGAADEMGTYLMLLKQSFISEQQGRQENENRQNKALEELKAEVAKLKNVNEKQKQKIDSLVAELNQKPNGNGWLTPSLYSFDYNTWERMSQIQTPSSMAVLDTIASFQKSCEKYEQFAKVYNQIKTSSSKSQFSMPKVGTSLANLESVLKKL